MWDNRGSGSGGGSDIYIIPRVDQEVISPTNQRLDRKKDF